jgi:hypothetical protein
MPEPKGCPPELQYYLQGTDPLCKEFQKNIRQYNAAMAFTAVNAKQDSRLGQGAHYFNYQIHGMLWHSNGPLEPAPGEDPKYAQLYIYDPDDATRFRSARNPSLMSSTLAALDLLLRDCNPYKDIYKTAHDRLRESDNAPSTCRVLLNPQLRLVIETGADKRRENLPTATEVAVVIEDDYEDWASRDIVLARRQNNILSPDLEYVTPTSASYMPLAYPLLFPRGDPGWHYGMTLQERAKDRQRTRLCQRMFYRYHMFPRNSDAFIPIFDARKLSQQYYVDAYASNESVTLQWIRAHQKDIRSELYSGVADAVLADDNVESEGLGRRVILPSSFVGSDRNMAQLYQDSMAIVRYFGRPTLFITFTANPKWPEITRHLGPGLTAADRPDLVTRVFHLKIKALLDELKGVSKNGHSRASRPGIFGKYLGHVYTIEYQKRGLPHCHLLLFLDRDDQFMSPERIDEIVCAELPDPAIDEDGSLREIITGCMLHGPCGEHNLQAVCMDFCNGEALPICVKRFPKGFQAQTEVQEDGYPLYRRRDNGDKVMVPRPRFPGQTIFLDNRHVVPYNPYLSKRYNAHINVEVCAGVSAIKYIHKYIYKGVDHITLEVSEEIDECKRYVSGRYIGSMYACQRLFEFPMHGSFPPVKRLHIHLDGNHRVFFDPRNEAPQDILDSREDMGSTLLAWFNYNRNNADGYNLTYQQFPEHFVFEKGQWKPRKNRAMAIGRMRHTNPTQGEEFYMRLLLTVVKGATSYVDLRTVQGVEYPTFYAACISLGLCENDNAWFETFDEAKVFASGKVLRSLFTTALIHGPVGNPLALWDHFKVNLCDDLAYHLARERVPLPSIVSPEIDYGLYLIQEALFDQGRTLAQYKLPSPQYDWGRADGNRLIQQELRHNVIELANTAADAISKMNEGQRAAFDTIVTAIESDPQTAAFFLQGPAGTGKTFVYTTLANLFRSRGKIVICVASSGIAALLLPGGRTSHSRLGIPIVKSSEAVSWFSKNSVQAELLKKADLLIWDEVPMQHKLDFECVHRSLCDFRSTDESVLFGGLPVVMGGDFAQILPVIKRAQRAQTVSACLQKSWIWKKLKILYLRQNMRLHVDANNTAYALWIRRITDDSTLYGSTPLYPSIRRFDNPIPFSREIYPNTLLNRAPVQLDCFLSHAILAVRNDSVNAINEDILGRMPGDIAEFYGLDSADVNEENPGVHQIPAEFLHTLQPQGMPPWNLRVKVGTPLILLRNINPTGGLCNGSRLVVTRTARYNLEVKHLGGQFHGQVALLPRVVLESTDGELPFKLVRKQYPVKLAFAMSVNKSQGQSLNTVGIDFRTPPFTHGQTYVALSRAVDLKGISVLLPNGSTNITNIVYPEVLLR